MGIKEGLSVAEEYLEARFRLCRMVYMHKTTRATEKTLGTILGSIVSDTTNHKLAYQEPVSRYLAAEDQTLDLYLALDDSAVWSAFAFYRKFASQQVSDLA